MLKILITGTAGFIGFHLCQNLISENFKVFGLDNINDYYDINLKYARLSETGINKAEIEYGKIIKSLKFPNYKFIKLNLEDKEQLTKLFKKEKFDIVCNLAAQAGVRYSITNPHAYIESNIVGFINILENCRNYNIKNLIYASSSSVYGLNSKMPFSTSDNDSHPISLYAATKKSNELMAHSYSHLYNLPTTGLRFFTVYGPFGRPDMALFLFTKAIYEGKSIKIFNNGEMRRDFTYIDDIVKGIVYVIQNPARPNPEWKSNNPENSSSSAPYKIYNVGNNNPVKLIDFINSLEKSIGKTAIKEFLPMQPGDVQSTYADISDLIKDFNYKPDTPIEKGINEFINWYKKFYKIDD
jgi:UDP-glucuronate 4-epimerase